MLYHCLILRHPALFAVPSGEGEKEVKGLPMTLDV